MTFSYWTDDNGDHCQIGRLRGDPGKHGRGDWRWGYPLGNENPLLPTVAEAVAIGPLVAIAQRDVFNPPPESIYAVDSWIKEMAECRTVREVMRTAQLIQMHWERRRLEAQRVRR
jgi:hypothetical protein